MGAATQAATPAVGVQEVPPLVRVAHSIFARKYGPQWSQEDLSVEDWDFLQLGWTLTEIFDRKEGANVGRARAPNP